MVCNVDIVENIPQQVSGTVDCGVIMCHVMKLIFEHKEVTSDCDASQARADLVHELLNNPERSWSLEKHRVLM